MGTNEKFVKFDSGTVVPESLNKTITFVVVTPATFCRTLAIRAKHKQSRNENVSIIFDVPKAQREFWDKIFNKIDVSEAQLNLFPLTFPGEAIFRACGAKICEV